MIDTGLKLEQNGAVPKDVIRVPPAAVDLGVKAEKWMFFQAEGDGSTNAGAILWVVVEPLARGAQVSPATESKLRTSGLLVVKASKLTKRETLRRFLRVELLMATIAVIIAIAGIGVAVTRPAAERVAAEAHLQSQALPLVQRIATATSPPARHQAITKLDALLAHRDKADSGVASGFTWVTIVLPLVSVLLLLGLAVKKALGAPQ